MSDPFFFGYGSLVNLATHDYADAHPAAITGWKRAWRYTSLREIAFLTAVPDPQATIDGMIAHVPGDNWAALDEREYAYDRHLVTSQVSHPVTRPLSIAIYAVPDASQHKPDLPHPILLSYLDVVVQGYLQVFGEEGAVRFFDTTDGWDSPVLNDRANPLYPRHQALSPAQQAFVDDQLAARQVSVIRDA
ncbi:MAG: gamma-glutamylcyclotransferase [Rhodobacteraceae bacterium]|nr:gamma-glutamylcyclotransferase [Paracoccaceae bacterium]